MGHTSVDGMTHWGGQERQVLKILAQAHQKMTELGYAPAAKRRISWEQWRQGQKGFDGKRIG